MSKLTIKEVEAIKAPGRHAVGDGLYLLIKPSGSRSWMTRVQKDGKRADYGLGSTRDVKLAEAREKASDLRRSVRKGLDPRAEKKAKKAELAPIPTFREAAKQAHQEHRASWKNGKHAEQWLSTLEAYAFPHIGGLPVDQIEGPQIRDLLAKIWMTIPETARRVHQRIGTVLDWAYAKGHRNSEAPLRSVKKGLPRQPKKDRHFASMPYTDLPAFMTNLAERETHGRLALRFLILTAARSGEVRLATWKEIDLVAKTWTVPAERMKAGKTHIVPLSEPSLAILKHMAKAGQRPDQLIFPGNGSALTDSVMMAHAIGPTKPLSDMTLTKVLRDNNVVAATVHGFRSSFRDWAAERTSHPGEVVEAALAHTIKNRVEAAYRRTNYLEKRTTLMADWASFLLGADLAGDRVPEAA